MRHVSNAARWARMSDASVSTNALEPQGKRDARNRVIHLERNCQHLACLVVFLWLTAFIGSVACSSGNSAPPLYSLREGNHSGAGSSVGSAAGSNTAGTPANGTGSGTACKPGSCSDVGASCGPVSDGCGHIITCGTCSKDQVCDANSHTCISKLDACATSACGFVVNACNNAVSCGAGCAAGSICHGNQCVACPTVSCDGRCGNVPDGCGGVVECGNCPKGSVCDAITFTCETCATTTCDDLPTGTCGQQSDGCGGVLQCPCATDASSLGACRAVGAECGTIADACIADLSHDCSSGNSIMGCAAGEMCENYKCVPCVPVTCAQAHWTCGSFYDTCGNKVVCGDNNGDCPAGQYCVGGTCAACTPQTCGSLDCGIISDGCGGYLTCGKNKGDCPAGSYCKSHVCTACPTKTCAANACGFMDTGCGYDIDCGTCAQAGESCVANVCTPCAPKTCAQLGKSCGQTDDGCGNMTLCGPCADGQVCLSNNTCCQPITCESFTGAGPDGCGGFIQCQG